MSFEILNPEPLGRPSGWNNGLLAPPGGRILFVAGQTAPAAPGLVAQWEGALERVLAVVRAARGGPGPPATSALPPIPPRGVRPGPVSSSPARMR